MEATLTAANAIASTFGVAPFGSVGTSATASVESDPPKPLVAKESSTEGNDESHTDQTTTAKVVEHVPRGERQGLKVLFLSSDTGGGHRASAEALAKQFELLYPGSTYELLDVASEAYLPPYNSIVSYYKHLSAHPAQWKLLYGVSNSRAMERVVDTNIKVMSLMCERSIRKKLKGFEADVVVSVHPLMTSIPNLSCTKISHETGKHLPMFTVITDLGSAHSTWFASGVERLFVGSQQIYTLAKDRHRVPEEKIVLVGLPIRHDFSVQAEKLGDRMSPEGKEYQRQVRADLGFPVTDRKTILVMGGGEGVGSLSNIVDALYVEFVSQGIDAVILVVCGRNEKLKKSLAERDYAQVLERGKGDRKAPTTSYNRAMFSDIGGCVEVSAAAGCIESGLVTNSLRKILSSGSLMPSESAFIPSPTNGETEEEKKAESHDETKMLHFKSASIGAIGYEHADMTNDDSDSSEPVDIEVTENVIEPELKEEEQPEEEKATEEAPAVEQKEEKRISNVSHSPGKVVVVGLGFVTEMAKYMVAADVLVSKAGPGTISEAAAVSLPVMLTSFLPGQEEGNVDYVVDGKFGAYCHDSDPPAIAEEVADWLSHEDKLAELSQAARSKGAPFAARDIVKQIGDSTLNWIDLNENHANSEALEVSAKDGKVEEISS